MFFMTESHKHYIILCQSILYTLSFFHSGVFIGKGYQKNANRIIDNHILDTIQNVILHAAISKYRVE